jgi:hypothetical protein
MLLLRVSIMPKMMMTRRNTLRESFNTLAKSIDGA